MTDNNLADIRAYFETHMLSEEVTAEKSGVTVEQLLTLVSWRCIPPHTHKIEMSASVSGCFGRFSYPAETQRFYHPSVIDWVAHAMPLLDAMSVHDAAEAIRAQFFDDFIAALDGAATPWAGLSAEQGAAYAWAYVIDGTWGACLKTIDIPSMLAKEYARVVFREVAALPEGAALTPDMMHRLGKAIAGYEAVAQDFAPHERPLSSKSVEYDIAKARLIGASRQALDAA